jgi:prepilin-type N-terminal cleavage/methylation domain-containing protein
MARIALLNKRGSSLIELLIAMTILAIVAAALMKSSILVLQKNVQNEMRDEAVHIAEQRMNEIRSGPGGFDETISGIGLKAENVALPAVSRTIRNGLVSFTVNKNVVELDGVGLSANTKQVTVTVGWLFRGQPNTHAVMSIARRYGQ